MEEYYSDWSFFLPGSVKRRMGAWFCKHQIERGERERESARRERSSGFPFVLSFFGCACLSVGEVPIVSVFRYFIGKSG